MLLGIWNKFKQGITIWSIATLPGIVVLVLIIFLRLNGSLQFIEWLTLDSFLRLRPWEPIDERVVIVGINEEDIRGIRNYPIPDHEIAKLLRTLQKYQPRVIGLDIVRDIPVEPGHAELVAAFGDIKNLIAVEKVIPIAIKPPPNLPSEQIGFVDILSDDDGKVRRAILGMKRPEDEKKYAFSLPLRLAETYLKVEGIELNKGIRELAMRCGLVPLNSLAFCPILGPTCELMILEFSYSSIIAMVENDFARYHLKILTISKPIPICCAMPSLDASF